MSKSVRTLLLVLKVLIAGYWVWVLRASIGPVDNGFDAVIALSAPLLLSLHFVQALMFLRLLRGRSPWWADFGQIMLFGVVHLYPLVRGARPGSPQGPKR